MAEANLGKIAQEVTAMVMQDLKDAGLFVGKWIPVSERLPKKKTEILVTTAWGDVTIATMDSANDWLIHEGAANAEDDEILAWIPLPEPYNKKSEKTNADSN